NKSLSAPHFVRSLRLNLLESHVAVQLIITSHENFTQTSPGVHARFAIADARLRHLLVPGAERERPAIAKGRQAGFDFFVSDGKRQISEARTIGQRLQTALWIVLVCGEVLDEQRLQCLSLSLLKLSPLDKYFSQRMLFVQKPGLHTRDQVIAFDERKL